MGDDELIEVGDGDVRWRFEPSFLRSNWTCTWGRGCLGILDVPTPELQQGCCSVGAELGDPQEAMNVAALAATLDPARWQHAGAVDDDGVFSDGTRTNTKIVDGACIFLNRPRFAGGEGCALHLAAVAAGESPIDWKPSVCWQLPVRVDWDDNGDGTETATVRRWSRADWGPEGETMAWCCTERPAGDDPGAYVGDRPVIESLSSELTAIVGEAVMVELRRRL
ncbi:MAG: hypothetical protein JWM12_1276 [Ilumatobacteraceae bacterium]|nr:hypothetical protein [Ilumatobacteraceae bacterium]